MSAAIKIPVTVETDRADKYIHNHGFVPEKTEMLCYTSIPILQFLWKKPWDNLSLGYVYAARPSCIRVIKFGHGTACDSWGWRVTISLEEDNRTISDITQEVSCVPPSSMNGYELDRLLDWRNNGRPIQVCKDCGTTELIAPMRDASKSRDGLMICGNLMGAWECEDGADCIRRQQVNMGPKGPGWQGPSL